MKTVSGKRQTKHCENCSAPMLVFPSRLKRKRFCSRPCLGVWRAKHDAGVLARLELARPRSLPAEMTQEMLRSLVEYDADTGLFTWLERRGGTADANGRAGGLQKTGYVSIVIGNKRYLAHRLAWFYVHGAWPQHQIDHVNGDRADNRLSNLREATNRQNQANRKVTSSSGVKGVSWSKTKRKWVAGIYTNKKRTYIGYFDDKAAASAAYMAKARELFGEFASDGVRVENAKDVSDA